MNDNRDETTGVEGHLIAYFRTDLKFFDFYSCLPDFVMNEVLDRRIDRQRRLLIQIKDREYFLHVTEYCFYRV